MKLLLNMNLPRRLMPLIEQHGHGCRHVGDIGMARSDDRSIVEHARLTGETILTHDLDYADLLAFSGLAHPSVVIFRLRDTKPESIADRLIAAWKYIDEPLTAGAIVTIADHTVRVRRLPVERE